MNIKIQRITPTAKLPTKVRKEDSGWDLYADSIEETDTQIKVHTGIAISPQTGWYCLIFPRSSVSKTNFSLANSVGLIDNLYTGEIILMFNKLGTTRTNYSVGERVGQIVPFRFEDIVWEEVDELDITSRGSGGFGSSGK